MANYHFTTIQGIKENTLVDANTNEKTLKVIQKSAEDVWLQEVLGTPLYNTLKTAGLQNTLTAMQKTLIEDYILNYVYALVEMLVVEDLLLKYSNNGVYEPNPDKSVRAQESVLRQQKFHKDKAVNFYCGLLKTYIENNITSFTEYNEVDEGVPSKKVINHGFYLDDDDYLEDDNYYRRKAGGNFEEGI